MQRRTINFRRNIRKVREVPRVDFALVAPCVSGGAALAERIPGIPVSPNTEEFFARAGPLLCRRPFIFPFLQPLFFPLPCELARPTRAESSRKPAATRLNGEISLLARSRATSREFFRFVSSNALWKRETLCQTREVSSEILRECSCVFFQVLALNEKFLFSVLDARIVSISQYLNRSIRKWLNNVTIVYLLRQTFCEKDNKLKLLIKCW